jgi:hypothetical protein
MSADAVSTAQDKVDAAPTIAMRSTNAVSGGVRSGCGRPRYSARRR